MTIVNCGGNAIDVAIKTLNGVDLKGTGNVSLSDIGAQSTLVSGSNIKTINSTSILGSGDIAVQPTLVSGTNIKTVNGNSLLGSGDVTLSDLGTRLKVATLSIATTDWTSTTGGYTCTKSIADITATALIIFPEVEGYPGMKCSSQTAGSITIFCDVTPSASVSVNVAYSIGGLE